jgi:type III secretion system FlhB-like substrate exporter
VVPAGEPVVAQALELVAREQELEAPELVARGLGRVAAGKLQPLQPAKVQRAVNRLIPVPP